MQRRDLFARTLAAGIATAAQGASAASGRLSPCLNEATTLDAPFEEDCRAYSAAGFKHIELWFAKLRKQGLTPSQVGNMLRQHSLIPVSACASEGCLWRQQGSLETHFPELEQNFAMAQALGVPRYVVFSFVAGRVNQDDYKTATERFVKVADSVHDTTCGSLSSLSPDLPSLDPCSYRCGCFGKQSSRMPEFASIHFTSLQASASLRIFGISVPEKSSTCISMMCRVRSPVRFWPIRTAFRPARE